MGFETWERGTGSARAIPRNCLAKAAKKVARKKVRAIKSPSTPAVEIVGGRGARSSGAPEQPEELFRAPESEEFIRICVASRCVPDDWCKC